MRVLLVNDTSNNNHLGCEAISNALRLHLTGHAQTAIRAIFNRELSCDTRGNLSAISKDWLHLHLTWADLMIVNGEGTMHHDRARELAAAMELAIEMRKPFAVVNSILEDYPSLAPLLRQAEAVTLRDRKSLREAAAMNVDAVLCADAAIYANWTAPPEAPRTSGSAVTDWHDEAPAITGKVALSHIEKGAHLFPFIRPDASTYWRQAIAELAHREHIVCGRYHGCFFALLAGRPITVLPSNSGKMRQLLDDLCILPEGLGEEDIWPIEVSAAQARNAKKRLMEMKADASLHPLHALKLSERRYSSARPAAPARNMGAMLFDANDEKRPATATIARRFSDWLKAIGLPGPPKTRGHRLAVEEALSELAPPALTHSISQLNAENCVEEAAYVAGKLAQADTSQAFRWLDSLRVEHRANAAVTGVFANVAAAAGSANFALTLYREADKISQPLTGNMALQASKLAYHTGRWKDAFTYARNALPSANASSTQFAHAAICASRAEEKEEAIAFARAALKAAPPLTGWPKDHVSVVLTANGEFVEGCRVLSSSFRGNNEQFSKLRERESADGTGRVIYIAPEIGVGSAILQALPSLTETTAVEEALTVVVDRRLHPVLARALPGRAEFVHDISEIGHLRPAQVREGFDLLADYGPRYGASGSHAVLDADEEQTQTLRERYTARFGTRPLIGIAWHTSNGRTGRHRNLRLADVRRLLARYPDCAFISLQPDLEKARHDSAAIEMKNLFIDGGVDPLDSIDIQLSQIGLLDAVVSIDCSAALFAGALGIRTKVILTGEPTWQWPEQSSFFLSHDVVRGVEDVVLPPFD
ncbi:hypothetical protein ASE61_07655 [Bosea sp. Root670]|uniref:polysaccharide pyruvyl transferase family protein n=1 Tax=Bosea sp. Root670 TaxID=1736583 RepID=UPI000712CA7E|nr:polysaccharide pyruvyl transferase family protein [Bosea sp. Root670]KRE04781.1 hypothetical protein ASE61_07655 [Bosea sp. Root670]